MIITELLAGRDKYTQKPERWHTGLCMFLTLTGTLSMGFHKAFLSGLASLSWDSLDIPLPSSQGSQKTSSTHPVSSWRQSDQIPPERGLQVLQQNIRRATDCSWIILSLSEHFFREQPLWRCRSFLCLTKKGGCEKEDNSVTQHRVRASDSPRFLPPQKQYQLSCLTHHLQLESHTIKHTPLFKILLKSFFCIGNKPSIRRMFTFAASIGFENSFSKSETSTPPSNTHTLAHRPCW